MSADLEFRLPPIRIRVSGDIDGRIEQRRESDEGDEADSECRTPTGEEYKIPAVLSCPPAPRKARPPPCKRKVKSGLRFFEIVRREEVDEFFRAGFDQLAAGSGGSSGGGDGVKRRCACK